MTKPDIFLGRWDAVAQRLLAHRIDVLLISDGLDLVYLTGYDARPSERMTLLVAKPVSEEPRELVVPRIEVPETPELADVFDVVPWVDDDDPIAMVADRISSGSRVAVSDELRADHLLALQAALPDSVFVSVGDALGGLRSVKSDGEMQAVQSAGLLANEVAAEIQRGEVVLVGRTELDIQAEVIQRLKDKGHETVEFCIVASGPNSASPHHNPTDRVVQKDEMVLFDFGGRHNGYCSDITRCVWTGPVPAEVASTYAILKRAQQAAVDAARPGVKLGDVDAAARDVITDAGYGENFTHRTGHGIGTEVHEQPYVKAGNPALVETGHAFSIEPGIYFDGKWGMRLEDIVVIVDDGAVRCSTTNHDLVEVEV